MSISDLFGGGLAIGVIASILVFVIACFLIVPFILMICWNFVMPQIFGLPELNIFTSFALCFICSILFGGIKITSK